MIAGMSKVSVYQFQYSILSACLPINIRDVIEYVYARILYTYTVYNFIICISQYN